MAVSFTRQLGAESGVQLNPLQDSSELPMLFDVADQCFGILMRATRGRIDKPFKVNRNNVYRLLGFGESMRKTRLNEAWAHVVEALNKGSYEAIVQRLVPRELVKLQYIVVHQTPYIVDVVDDKGITVLDSNGIAVMETRYSYQFTVEDNVPNSDFLLAIKHLGCFNDGLFVSIHADEHNVGGVSRDNNVITLRLLDPKDKGLLYEFKGSLDSNAMDDAGNSTYIVDVISAQTDMVQAETGDVHTIHPLSDIYGYSKIGKEKWITSPLQIYFSEGTSALSTTGYSLQDIQFARQKLQYTPHNYSYISSGGSRSYAILSELSQLSFDTNRQLKFDIGGELPIEAAVAFVESLNIGSMNTSHLIQAFWTPLQSNDPTGINPKGYFGSATLNIAMANLRNASTNARGFAPKNYPVAGKEFPVSRTRITQMVDLTDQDLNTLAKAKINPVVFETYTGGGRYVFRDSLTCALTETSMRKLSSVADMSASIDDAVTRFGKDITQTPMKIAVKRMADFLTSLFEGAEASGWIVPAADPEMRGKSFRFEVKPNVSRPADRLDVNYWVRYDGVARQIFVTQTLVI